METLKQCEICLKSTIKTPQRVQRRCGVFFNFEKITHIVPVFSLLTLNKLMLAGVALLRLKKLNFKFLSHVFQT